MASYIIEIRRPNTVGPLGGNAIATYRFDCKADREALAMLRVSQQPLLRKMRPGDVVVMHSARHQYDVSPRTFKVTRTGFEAFDLLTG